MHFVCNCHNFADDPAGRDPAFDDGGFFFVLGDPPRNKAGVAGTDRRGRERFASYGSTTADGLRGLLAGGVPLDHPRAEAARRWLEQNFSAASPPGTYARGREGMRSSVYYYYRWSLARALLAAGVREVTTPAGPVPWAEARSPASYWPGSSQTDRRSIPPSRCARMIRWWPLAWPPEHWPPACVS